MADKYATDWNDDDLRRAMREAPQTYNRIMDVGLDLMLQDTRKVLVKNSPGSAGGEGNVAAGWQIIKSRRPQLSGNVRSAVPYTFYADKGRKPGKMPPYDPIEQWVHRMGLGTRATGAEREERRPEHKRTPPREERRERKPRKPRLQADDEDRESIIWRIRKKIGDEGTYKPKPAPNFVAKSHREVEPIIERHYLDSVNAFVAAVSTT
ncbi:MAG: hypothetical protein ACPGWS_05445 [Solirubrobacterales bacterium]